MRMFGGVQFAGMVAVALGVSGCITDQNGGGGAFLGRSTAPSGPSPQQIAESRRESRISELEQSVNRLRSEVDAMGASLNSLSARTDAFSRQFDARSADTVALRGELAASREELRSVKAKLDGIPGTFSKLLDEQGKSIRADVDRSVQARIKAIPAAPSGQRSASRSGKFYEHEIGAGQTLSEIASVYGVSVETIVSENNIKNASLIRAGQKLLIPAK